MTRALLLGSDHLGLRILEKLRRDGYDAMALAPEDSWLARAPLPDGVSRVLVDAAGLDLTAVAPLDGVESFFAVTDRDEMNLAATLEVLEINPNLKVVLRQFNMRLGRLVASELPQCQTLSLSAIAAPTFAVAAVTPGVVLACEEGDRLVVLREVAPDDPSHSSTHTVLAARAPSGVVWLADGQEPPVDADRLLVATDLAHAPPYPPFLAVPHPAPRGRLRRRFDRLLLATLGSLSAVVVAAAFYFQIRLGMDAIDAFYFVVTTITSVGFGDFSLRETDTLTKLVGMGVMVAGVASMAVIVGLVTNELLARQQAFQRGQVRSRLKGHIVVCGLGIVGYRVSQMLAKLGHRVVVVESNEDGRFVAQARAEGFQIVVGDASSDKALRYANAAQARAIVVCTNPDFLNLEIGLHARSLLGDVPIVLRMFDPDFSRRVASHFHIDATFSSASLAAARFVGAATGSSRIASLQFGGDTYELRRIEIECEEAVGAVRKRTGGIVAALARAGEPLRLSVGDDERLAPADALYLVAPRGRRS